MAVLLRWLECGGADGWGLLSYWCGQIVRSL
jgi:hypothetical protein